MKKYIFIIIAICLSFNLNAQVKTTIFPNGDAFKEFSFLYQINEKEIPLYEMPSFNLDSVIKEENYYRRLGDYPFRFGYAFDVDYGIEHGKWSVAEDKNIWSIRFKSNGAYTLNFRLSDLKLDYLSELYIYNSNGTLIYGPVTHKDNATKEFNSIGTDLIPGEVVIIQIIEPKSSMQTSKIKITGLVHGFENYYKDIFPSNKKEKDNFQATLTCHNDVMCYPNFENLSRGVIKLLMGGYLCSGSLLNNTMGTNRPYVLTALHCADIDENGILSSAEKTAIGYWTFQFNYKRICSTTSIVSYVLYNYGGAYFRASWQPTDFLLVELKESVKDTNIRFLGWDITGYYPYQPISIHHPAGDPMKISFDNHTAYSNDTEIRWRGGTKSPLYTHFKVGFDNGSTEGGSSGSPLFGAWEGDPEYRIIGQLHGGDSGCPVITKYYGRFSRSWSYGSTIDQRLKEWINPYNQGVIVTNAIGTCQSTNYWDKVVPSVINERIICKDINVKNVTVPTGTTLELESTGGSVKIDGNFKVEEGATFIIK